MEDQGDVSRDQDANYSDNWAMQLLRLAKQELSEHQLELFRLSGLTRRVIEAMVSRTHSQDDLSIVSDAIEKIVDTLEAGAKQLSYEGFAESANSGDTSLFFDRSPVMGRANPLAPPMHISVSHDASTSPRVIGRVTYGIPYEGPPGCVHGGLLAAGFDEVLGMAQSLGGSPGMTANLTVSYLKPTPLHKEIRFEADLDRVDGRKHYTSAKCYFEDTVTATAEGLFISVDFSKLAELARSRNQGEI